MPEAIAPTLKEVVATALELPQAQRDAYLERACGKDDDLRDEAAALLGLESEAEGFLEESPMRRTEAPLDGGQLLGPYRILRPLGSGGMGDVYLAERADGAFEQQVAIKVIRCSSPGIFVESSEGIRELDPSTYTQAKSGGHFLSSITYGIKSVKSKAVINGASSMTRLPRGSPTFYFCFEETETGLSYETRGATNPSEFLLVQFTVDNKKQHRWFVTGKLNAWAGAQSGAPPKVLRSTSHEKITAGVYRVTPRAILVPGEYGFYYAGSAPAATYGGGGNGGKKIFTFSVSG